MSLVDKLDGICIGDILQLSNHQGSVVGYMAYYTPNRITLSHEDPTETKRWTKKNRALEFKVHIRPKGYKMFFPGNRTYNLKDFDKYKILQKHEKKGELIKAV